jgi:hypothetical protein
MQDSTACSTFCESSTSSLRCDCAAIFSMSQALPVLGLDYFQGKGGKLMELFYDSGRSDWARTIGAFEAAWLVEKMEACIKAPIHH